MTSEEAMREERMDTVAAGVWSSGREEGSARMCAEAAVSEPHGVMDDEKCGLRERARVSEGAKS